MNVSDLPLDSQRRLSRARWEDRQAGGETLAVLPWLTIEVALYGLLGLLALVSRLYALGNHPLSTSEATQALHAWQAVSGPGGEALTACPLLFAGQTLAFAVLGAGDGAARLLPALAGVVLVLLPYLLRHRLGRIGALAASALLLISPTVLFASRSGNGDLLLLTAGLAALVGLVGWVDFRRPSYLYLSAVSAALALTAAPGVYSLVLALAAGLGLLALLGESGAGDDGWTNLQAAWEDLRLQREWLRNGVALFAGTTLILLPTTLLLHLEGIQAVADLFLTWVNHFAPWAGDQPLGYSLAVLLLYEPLPLVFGLAGVAVVFWRRDLLGRLLAVWVGAAFFISLLAGGRGPGDALLVVGPLTLLAGRVLGRLLEDVLDHRQWVQDGLIVGLLMGVAVFSYLQLATYAFRRDTGFPWLVVLSLGLLIGFFGLYLAWSGRQAGWRGGGLALAILLSLVMVSSATNLAYLRSHDPRELLVVEGTSPNVRDLPALLEGASMQRLGAVEVIPITLDASVGPVVRWYLRDFRQQTWLSTAPGPDVTTEAVVVPQKLYTPDLGAAYFGTDFAVRTTWQPQNMTWVDWANWLLFRKSPDRLQEERVVLWLSQQGE
jgi:uncharacterized protein (TIGR03663 family)